MLQSMNYGKFLSSQLERIDQSHMLTQITFSSAHGI